MALRFAAKCALFGALLVLSHLLMAVLRGPRDIPELITTIERAFRSPDVDIVYVGDSSLFMGHPGEPDAATIPEMLQAAVPGLTVAEISTPAADSVFYEAVSEYTARNPGSVRYVIIPLNLRLLGPQLETTPYRHFDREVYFLRQDSIVVRMAYRPLTIFKAIETPRVERDSFHSAAVLDGDRNLGPLGELHPGVSTPVTDAQRARLITFSYMYRLGREDPAVGRLQRVARNLRVAGIQPVFYVTPVDVQACTRDLGEQFSARIDENVSMLVESLAGDGLTILDLSQRLTHEHFSWENFPNEHLKASGRYVVAAALADTINSLEQREVKD